MLQTHERLKKVFEQHVGRLKRRFGIGDHAYKWLRDTEDLGTGAANPLDRVRDLIDEAWIVDPTGEGARLIAQDPIDYYEFLTRKKIKSLNQIQEVNTLLEKVVSVACQMNIHDIRRMEKQDRKDLLEKLSGVGCAVSKITAWLNSESEKKQESKEKSNASHFMRR